MQLPGLRSISSGSPRRAIRRRIPKSPVRGARAPRGALAPSTRNRYRRHDSSWASRPASTVFLETHRPPAGDPTPESCWIIFRPLHCLAQMYDSGVKTVRWPLAGFNWGAVSAAVLIGLSFVPGLVRQGLELADSPDHPLNLLGIVLVVFQGGSVAVLRHWPHWSLTLAFSSFAALPIARISHHIRGSRSAGGPGRCRRAGATAPTSGRIAVPCRLRPACRGPDSD